MPFNKTCPVEEPVALMRDYGTAAFSVADLCRRHGISRETIYVWKRRREGGGERWFEQVSHRPYSCPHRTDDECHLNADGVLPGVNLNGCAVVGLSGSF